MAETEVKSETGTYVNINKQGTVEKEMIIDAWWKVK